MGVWLAAALVLSWLLWQCEANAGTCSSVLSPAERAAPGWRHGERQQVYREAEQAQWRAQPAEGRHRVIVCSAAWGEGQHTALRPQPLQPVGLWTPRFNLCRPVCSFISSPCVLWDEMFGFLCTASFLPCYYPGELCICR